MGRKLTLVAFLLAFVAVSLPTMPVLAQSGTLTILFNADTRPAVPIWQSPNYPHEGLFVTCSLLGSGSSVYLQVYMDGSMAAQVQCDNTIELHGLAGHSVDISAQDLLATGPVFHLLAYGTDPTPTATPTATATPAGSPSDCDTAAAPTNWGDAVEPSSPDGYEYLLFCDRDETSVPGDGSNPYASYVAYQANGFDRVHVQCAAASGGSDGHPRVLAYVFNSSATLVDSINLACFFSGSNYTAPLPRERQNWTFTIPTGGWIEVDVFQLDAARIQSWYHWSLYASRALPTGTATPTPTVNTTPSATPSPTSLPTAPPSYGTCTYVQANAGDNYSVVSGGDWYARQWRVFSRGADYVTFRPLLANGSSYNQTITGFGWHSLTQHTVSVRWSSDDDFVLQVCAAVPTVPTATPTTALFATPSATSTASATPTTTSTASATPTTTSTRTPVPTPTLIPTCLTPESEDSAECVIIGLQQTQIAMQETVYAIDDTTPELTPFLTPTDYPVGTAIAIICTKDPCYNMTRIRDSIHDSLNIMSNVDDSQCIPPSIPDGWGSGLFGIYADVVAWYGYAICWFIDTTTMAREFLRMMSVLGIGFMLWKYWINHYRRMGDV